MRKIFEILAVGAAAMALSACGSGSRVKDRTEARLLFDRVSSLTQNYTSKIAAATDSASWAAICTEYEDSLDKVNFSFAPDTDLLLTEGQNDTITALVAAYIKARDHRIHTLLHPSHPNDSLPAPTDSLP